MANNSTLRDHPTEAWIEEIRQRFPTEMAVDRALTAKLKRRAQPVQEQGSHADLSAQVNRFVASIVSGQFSVTDLKTLSGGASKEQYHFWLNCDENGREKNQHLMLRREPAESISETDREREVQLFRAMEGIVPVPSIFGSDFDGSYFGRPAMVCTFANGVTKPTVQASGNVSGIGNRYPADYREILAPDFVKRLAQIHTFDISRADFSAFEIPEIGSTSGNERLINWWARIWYEDRLEDIPLMAVTERWLRDNMPVVDSAHVVHGDYRAGNFLFDEESKKITAILDWELGWLGDYHADIAYVMFDNFTATDENGKPLLCGLISRDEFVELYEKESGLKIDPKRLDYFTIFTLWRAIIQVLGPGLRSGVGLRSHQSVMMSWVSGIGYPMLKTLREKLEELCV